jgi:hypothetical protein
MDAHADELLKVLMKNATPGATGGVEARQIHVSRWKGASFMQQLCVASCNLVTL